MLNKLKKNNSLKILILLIFLVLIITIFTTRLINQVNQPRKCGDNNYIEYSTPDAVMFMYNTTNSKMSSRSIIDYLYSVSEFQAETLLRIKIKENDYISFIPESNTLNDEDFKNIQSCYPQSSFELETNIKREGQTIINSDIKKI